ncbi:8820_t:CDS:1 [Cetraspora pellucida]|uniref:8820_t:CDS:1 n=1 Tax=Cetraspora pellucida TaxID=1433469 RepID=A0ACA9KU17_9GLOM|nr:8820_t:CDS:1 [Cetraspora pellucida]
MVYWWIKKKKQSDPKYHEKLAHHVKDLILGGDNKSHDKRRKRVVKALQNDVTAQGMITILKSMPDPDLPSTEVGIIDNVPLPNKQDESSKECPKKVIDANSSLNSVKSIKPPLDRISCDLHWWGYEIYIPQHSMGRLDQAQSVSSAFLFFLQTIVGNSSPISPYFGFISAWVGLQFSIIKSQDSGNGVIIAATW